MKKIMAFLAFGSTLFMLFASILMITFFDFNVTNELPPPPVRLYLEPAGYAFIIWLFIYIGFLALGVYQLRPKFLDDPSFIKARPYIIINGLANTTWFLGVLYAHIWLTALCMLILLYTLIQISIHLELGKAGENLEDKLFVKLPIALYFGWITAATPINITSFLLIEVGWTGQNFLSPELWSVIILGIAFVIFALLYTQQRANATYLFVAVWALLAIYIANRVNSLTVGFTALTLALGLLIIFIFFQFRGNSKPSIL